MRKGTSKSGILTHEGVFFGVCLGADFCAEHEHGIDDLRQSFGVNKDSKELGVKRLQITKMPDDKMTLFSKGDSTYLLCSQSVAWAKDVEKFRADFHRHPHELSIYSSEKYPCNMAGAWSSRDFGIHIKGKEGKALLNELFEAFKKNDVAFGWTSAMPAFDNAGLCLFIVSKFPKVFDDSLIAQQVEKNRLKAAADKTGLIAYLDSKGKGEYKGYFACSPHFDSKYPDGLRWWFNSYNQQEDASNWFSTQEIKDWADGKEGNPISKHGYAYQKKGV